MRIDLSARTESRVRLGARAWQSLVLAIATMALQACVTTGGAPEKKVTDAAQYNAQLGARYLQRDDLDQARQKLEKALEQDSNNALAHITFAQLQHRVSKNTLAASHFRRGIRLETDDANLAAYRNAYGVFLCQTGAADKALVEFTQAAENPYYRTPEFALDNAGLCMIDQNRLDEAENFLREALRKNPQFANAYLHMAELLHRRDRLTVAEAYYQRYLANGQETAESLLLGMKIRRDDGDQQGAERYASRLLNEFPASEEAGEYLSPPEL